MGAYSEVRKQISYLDSFRVAEVDYHEQKSEIRMGSVYGFT